MINKATLLARIGKKDSKELKNGIMMATLYVATSRKYKDSKGESQETTVWHNVNFFNKLAEIVNKYAHVGDLVYIEGEINNKQITTGEKQGQWAYSVTGNEIKFLPTGRKKSDESKADKKVIDETSFNDDMIPF
jgi:single-strand DNA-binding protein